LRGGTPRLPAGKLVQLVDVRHSYGSDDGAGENAVLRGVDLAVEVGEFVAIHGRSGSGKTTLLYILGGILPPKAGRVLVGGNDLSLLSDRDLSKLRNRTIGFIFQGYHLAPVLTTLENVMVPALLAGFSAEEARRRAMEKLAEVGLEERAASRPSGLSGGQMQRVAIARALVNDPAILLADEPTGNLDRHTARQVLDLLGRYHRERGLTVIMATHDPAVRSHAGRRLTLSEGKLRPFGGEISNPLESGGQEPDR